MESLGLHNKPLGEVLPEEEEEEEEEEKEKENKNLVFVT